MACQLQCTNVQLEQCHELMRSHRFPMASPQALWAKLREGVLADGDKYFWLSSQDQLGVELYARAHSISWSSNSEYWTYSYEKIINTDYTVEVAKLENMCLLDVKGEFDMRKLTVGGEYEIFFDFELTHEARGWSSPVTFEHNNSFGSNRKFEMKLDHLVGKGRTRIPIGKFKLPCLPLGTPNATFHMHQHNNTWKKGLIMRGIIIKPAPLRKFVPQTNFTPGRISDFSYIWCK